MRSVASIFVISAPKDRLAMSPLRRVMSSTLASIRSSLGGRDGSALTGAMTTGLRSMARVRTPTGRPSSTRNSLGMELEVQNLAHRSRGHFSRI